MIYTAIMKTDGTSHNLGDYMMSGSITQAVNQIDSLTFTLPYGCAAYSAVTPMLSTVTVRRNDTYIFKGRVINVDNSMSEDGKIIKTVTCEGLLGYAHDGVCPAHKYTSGHMSNQVFTDLLSANIDSGGHDFQCGDYGDIQGLPVLTELDYCDFYEALQTVMVGGFGGEIRARYDREQDVDVIDYAPTGFGEVSSTPINLAVNMKQLTQKIDASSIVTRLYAYGGKGEDGTRLTMSILGQTGKKEYIQDDDLVAVYGILPEVVFFDDIGAGWKVDTQAVTSAVQLYNKALEYFETVKAPAIEYEVSALDLSMIKQTYESFELYNTYTVNNRLMSISGQKLRVVGTTIDLLSPQNGTLTFATV